jgi:hypothetical protein
VNSQALATKIIDYNQSADFAAIEEVIGHKVHDPTLV